MNARASRSEEMRDAMRCPALAGQGHSLSLSWHTGDQPANMALLEPLSEWSSSLRAASSWIGPPFTVDLFAHLSVTYLF